MQFLISTFHNLSSVLLPYLSYFSFINVDHILAALLSVTLFLYIFFLVYILVMGIYRAHLAKRLNSFTYVLCSPVVLIGYILDVFSNIFIMPFVFLEVPKELLVTTRLTRYMNEPENNRDWRYVIAKSICSNMLDIFDPTGAHCKI